jgi:hypothetical protein
MRTNSGTPLKESLLHVSTMSPKEAKRTFLTNSMLFLSLFLVGNSAQDISERQLTLILQDKESTFGKPDRDNLSLIVNVSYRRRSFENLMQKSKAEEKKIHSEPGKLVNDCGKLISVKSPVARNVQHFENLTEEPHEMCTFTQQKSPNLLIMGQNRMQESLENCDQPMGTKLDETIC